ncbi:uncharacterized protein [Choristoneura fumiferana]|uniref:uncharacterized protein n=1 Tax=Choristoneura fumiferana TaxID=7141 RepID=UPI003D158912
MGREKSKKRKKKEGAEDRGSSAEDSDYENDVDKYRPYKVTNYSRKYPENSQRRDFVVFLTHQCADKPFSDGDKVNLSQAIRKYAISGVLHLRPMNKYKVAITFDLSNNANTFLGHNKFLDELGLNASIPAADTEVTGVVKSVPVGLSNKNIFAMIGSSRNVIQVRRFMRRVRADGGEVAYIPTQTVAVTFASTQLPEYVYLDSWRHEVTQYVPPVKQCLKCQQFGHIAKFCKNNEVCSICSENHNYKACGADKQNPVCANCKGKHIAISASCPIKKTKIEENKIKSRTAAYADLFNEKSFPQLAARTAETYLENMLKSQSFLNMITQVIIKLVANKNESPINTETIRAAFQGTIRGNAQSKA